MIGAHENVLTSHRPSASPGTTGLEAGAIVVFTIYWPTQSRWEGVDYQLVVG